MTVPGLFLIKLIDFICGFCLVYKKLFISAQGPG